MIDWSRRGPVAYLATVAAFTWIAASQGCRDGEDNSRSGSPEMTAESVLFGGDRCEDDDGCASGYCTFGMCSGFLMAPTDAMRTRMAPGVRAMATGDDGELASMLSGTLGESESDQYLRGRAADALSLLPPRVATRILAQYLDDPSVPVRFFTARSLHRLGDVRGTRALKTFLEHPSEAVRMMASVELGHPDEDS